MAQNPSSERGRRRPLLGPMLLASTMLSGIPVAIAAGEPSGGLETVIVTAQKREENLQKVPMNVQAITTAKLEELHLTNFNDFQAYMPSVTFSVSGQGSGGGPGFANITMRGITSDQNGNHSGPLPTVGVYLDEQPITTIGGTLDVPTYDIERVEALSGPQGTLYGASAESGVIRIITNKPDPTAFTAGYSVEGNAVDHGGLGYIVDGYINEPLTDNIAVRLVAWDEHDAGYIDNVHGTRTYPTSGITIDNANRVKKDYNTVDKVGARAALGIDLDNNWTITPMVVAQWEKSDGFFGYDPSVGYLEVTHFLPEFTKDNWYQAALTIQGKVGDLNVLYSGGYMHRIIHEEADYTDYSFWYDTLNGSGAYFYDNFGNLVDPSQYIVGKDAFTKQSHELRVSSDKDQRLRFVAGAFYERQTHFILQDYKVVGDIADSETVTGWPHTIWLTDQYRVDRDYALFGEASFDILPNLTLTGGIRLFKADNSLQGFFGFAAGFSSKTGEAKCFLPFPLVDNGPCTDLNIRVRQSGETHKLNLTWQIDDDRMVYVTYSTGFRPPGVNRRIDIPGVPPSYAADSLDNYEVGWKTSWYDNRLRFNGDFFWENWNKFQFPFLGPQSVTIIANAGNARSRGAEAEVSWLPIDNLTLSGSGAFTEADLMTNYCSDLALVKTCTAAEADSPAGTQLPITPKWKLNGTARYEFTVAGLDAHVQGSAVYVSGRWADLRKLDHSVDPPVPVRELLGKVRGSTTVDLSTGIGHDNWSLDLALLNVFDATAEQGRFPQCNPSTCGYETYILPSRPRTVALTFSQKF